MVTLILFLCIKCHDFSYNLTIVHMSMYYQKVEQAMMHVRRKSVRSEEGFSLVELLVVIIVIGILAAIGLALFNDAKRYSIRASAYQDVKHAEIEISTWLATEKPVLGQGGSGPGQVVLASKTGDDPLVDNTGTQYYPVAGKLNIPISDPKTSIIVDIKGSSSLNPTDGLYTYTIRVSNSAMSGMLIYHPTQGGRTSGSGVMLEGWK